MKASEPFMAQMDAEKRERIMRAEIAQLEAKVAELQSLLATAGADTLREEE